MYHILLFGKRENARPEDLRTVCPRELKFFFRDVTLIALFLCIRVEGLITAGKSNGAKSID